MRYSSPFLLKLLAENLLTSINEIVYIQPQYHLMLRYCCITIAMLLYIPTQAQNVLAEANRFIKLLTAEQQQRVMIPFDSDERYNFNYIPLNNRKGIAISELNNGQRLQVFTFLRSSLNNVTVDKITAIMQLETVLKQLEQRSVEDHYRDPEKYFITVFGVPSDSSIWGWRFEGHHISFNFSADKHLLLSGTPSFLGSNPATVLSGPQKGKEILKEETTAGFTLLHSLSAAALKKAVISTTAPSEIITGNDRKAMIEHPEGVRFTELNTTSQLLFLRLLDVYLHRYKKDLADKMLQEIKKAGMENLRFAWAGEQQRGVGKPCYYRIHGPSIIIEYDNTQNNANHIHTVIRDLNNDFGGDALLDHYQHGHHHKK